MNKDTICAPATASGGAIAVIRVSGPCAVSSADALFSRSLDKTPPRQAVYGHILDEQGDVLDDVVLTVFRAPHSYTGEDSVEISCHGSSYIVGEILRLLTLHGCRMAEPGEFTQRAFLAGKMDLSQAEAVADLISSTTAAQHHAAFAQLRGSITDTLSTLQEQLLHLTTLLELELDFSDHEELEFADRAALISLSRRISEHIQSLINSYATGNAIRNGIPVAIIGAPNVGKSTLLNQLVGEERAIVSPIQGTTRDIVEDTAQIDGLVFRFLDTAGLRHTTDQIESIGIRRSLKAAEQASIILMLNEPGIPFPEIAVRTDQHIIRRTNKTDDFSALNGIGLNELRRELRSTISPLDADGVVITSARQHDLLRQAHHSLAAVHTSLTSGLSSDLVAEDLRHILHLLGQLTGATITSQDTLNNIFSHFCVGK